MIISHTQGESLDDDDEGSTLFSCALPRPSYSRLASQGHMPTDRSSTDSTDSKSTRSSVTYTTVNYFLLIVYFLLLFRVLSFFPLGGRFATKNIVSHEGICKFHPVSPASIQITSVRSGRMIRKSCPSMGRINTLLSSGNPTILYNLYVCYRLEKTSSIACILISICSRRINKTDRATGWAHSFIPALDIWSRSRITINQSTRPLNFTGHRCAAH